MPHRPHAALPAIFIAAAAATAATACVWDRLDAIAALTSTGVDDASTDVLRGAEASATGDGAAPGDATTDASTPPDGPSSAPCEPQASPIDEWTFDSNVQSWVASTDTGVQASLTWTDATGQPTAGALEFDVTPRASDSGSTSGAWAEYEMPLGNLSGRTLAAWARLESGTSPQLKVFAQSGSQYIWADNGTIYLEPQTWTCVSLPISSPSFMQSDFDPTDVIRIGFETLGTAPFQIAFDTVVLY